jgi:adenylate cyclase
MRDEMRDEDPTTTLWRGLLTGTDPTLLKMRARWRHVPSAPRCKVCASPFHGIGGAFARLFWHGPMPNNPALCKICFGKMASQPGGAEIPISVVFADVRGSTGLAVRT